MKTQIREGETLDAYIERLDDLIADLDDTGTFEDWIWANLERGYCVAVRDAEKRFLGDLSRFTAPLGHHTPPARPPAERNSPVVTNALITAGVLLTADCGAYS